MATTNYNLPTISDNMTADVVRDHNALAEAVDTNLATVDTKITQHLEQNAVVKHLDTEIGVNVAGLTANNLNEALLELLLIGNSQKEELVDKLLLIDPSLPITHESTWSEILSAISMVNTGRKWASGTVKPSNTPSSFTHANGLSSDTSCYPAVVTNINFEPSVIIMTAEISSYRYLTVYLSDGDSFAPKIAKVSQYSGANYNTTNINYKVGVSGLYVDSTGFCLPTYQTAEYNWIAYE